jgi:putative oxidoreductase
MSEVPLDAKAKALSWICQIVAAVILAQTLYFKFTAAPESVYIFHRLGMEPWGRIGSGIAELIAVLLLLTPRFAWAGSLLSMGVISGALMAHLTRLGIEVQGDKGLLFGLALVTFASSAVVAFLHRHEIPFVSTLGGLGKVVS